MKRWTILLAFVVILPVLVLLAPVPVEAAVFLKISGVAGESTDKDHDKWIDVVAVSPSITRSTTTKAGGKVQVNDISITKAIDASSPLLQNAMVTGRKFDEVVIHVTGTTGTVMKIQTLKKATITRIMPGFDSKTGARTEQVTFTAEAVK